jgi:hypothetical protein
VNATTVPRSSAQRSRWLLLAALLSAAGAYAKGNGADPSKVAHARFYEKAAAESIRKGTLDPNEYLDGTPWQVEFQKPGRLQVVLGQETESCTVAAEEAGKPENAWTLSLKCSSGSQTATWTWLDDKRAETDLFDAGRPKGSQRKTVEVVRLDREFNALLAEVESKFSERSLAALAGTWKDDAGAKLLLPAKGSAALDGGRWHARVLSCPLDPAKPKEQVRCLELTGPEEKSVFFAAMPAEKGAFVLVEGNVPPDPAGRFFEKKEGGRRLVKGK